MFLEFGQLPATVATAAAATINEMYTHTHMAQLGIIAITEAVQVALLSS